MSAAKEEIATKYGYYNKTDNALRYAFTLITTGYGYYKTIKTSTLRIHFELQDTVIITLFKVFIV